MNHLLTKYLKKLGIADSSELHDEEKATFDNWKLVLAKDQLTIDDLKNFCEMQVSKLKAKLKDIDNTDKKNDRLLMQFAVYEDILDVMDSPKRERERLEKHLQSLIES